MDERQAVAWLHRRAGFGLHPAALDEAGTHGAGQELATMFASADVPADPWAGLALDPEDGGRLEAVVAWVSRMFTTTTPFADRRSWMLHGWLVSSMDKVTIPALMVEQIRRFMTDGGGSFPALLRSITTDRAMLVYLDGRTSTGASPNENYARELMELFALGVGEYTEADVQAAARALTGWVAAVRHDAAVFLPGRHDDSPQDLLGVAGVHDVDSVIDAVVAHPAHPRFVADRIVTEYLGDLAAPVRGDVVDELAAVYVAGGMALDPVIERALQLGLDGATAPMVLAPIPWLTMCARMTGIPARQALRSLRGSVRDMGQIPLVPPSVAGWPTGTAWLTSSSLVARTNAAAGLARATADDEPLLVAAADGDVDRLAELLGLAEPFSTATIAAITSASDPTARLALALVCPENLLS